MSQRYDFIQELKNLPYNIKNIIGWSKVLWNNFDWDHAFLLEVLEYKLSRMKKYFENGKITTVETYDEMLEKLNIALTACNQLVSRDFESELIDPHYEKYPFHVDEWTDEQGRKVHGKHPMKGQERKDFLAIDKKIKKQEKKYKHQLFDTMRDYHDWWWD
jgi:inorganic triphosphatase YgiF